MSQEEASSSAKQQANKAFHQSSHHDVSGLHGALTASQVSELLEVFDLFDQQGHGKMNCTDLRIAFQVLGIDLTREQTSGFTTLYSSDKKVFTKNEWLEVCQEMISPQTDEEKMKVIGDAFQLLDTGGSGVITPKQLSRELVALNKVATEAEAGEIDVASEAELDGMMKDLGIEDVGFTKAEVLRLLSGSSTLL